MQKDVNHFIPLYTVFTVHVQCDTLSEPITFSVNAANSTLDCRRPHTQASVSQLGGEIRCTFVKVTRVLSGAFVFSECLGWRFMNREYSDVVVLCGSLTVYHGNTLTNENVSQKI